MIFNIFLSVIFLSSLFILWSLIGKRIPELLAVEDSVLIRHLEEDSSRLRFFLLEFKNFFRGNRYELYLLKLALKILVKIKFAILYLDKLTTVLLRKIKIRLGSKNNAGANYVDNAISVSLDCNEIKVVNDIYWDILKDKNISKAEKNSGSSLPL